jgi:hypothetical protein
MVDPIPKKKKTNLAGLIDPIIRFNPCIMTLSLGSLTQKALKGIDFTSMNQIKI